MTKDKPTPGHRCLSCKWETACIFESVDLRKDCTHYKPWPGYIRNDALSMIIRRAAYDGTEADDVQGEADT